MREVKVIDGKKPCSKCKCLLPVHAFGPFKSKSGLRPDCRECQRRTYSRVPVSENRRHRKILDGKQRCTMCSEWKPEDQFETHKNCRNGRGSRCKACSVIRTNAILSSSMERFLRDVARKHRTGLKFRAKRRGKKHLWQSTCITYEFLQEMYDQQEGRCAVTGIQMTHKRGDRGEYRNVSIDRMDSDKGYEPDNVRLVCKAVNLMKHEMEQSELEFWCLAILEGNRSNSPVTV